MTTSNRRHAPSPHSSNATLRGDVAGFTLVLAVLVIGVILAIGLSILNVTLKELILSGYARESAVALSAADAGMECALYWDTSSEGNRFDDGAGASTITCMETDTTVNGTAVGGVTTHELEYEWGTPTLCAQVEVVKYYSASEPLDMGPRTCPAGSECSRIVSRGYNRACDELDNPRTVERALRALY